MLSYLQRDRQAAGLAGAAPSGGASIALQRALASWRAVMRTRQFVVAEGDPLCWGAVRAQALLDGALSAGGGQVRILAGTMPHYSAGAGDEGHSALSTDELDRVAAGTRVVIGPAGVAPTVRASLVRQGLRVIDATCPLVTAAQAEVRRFAAHGESVLLIGPRDSAVLPGMVGQAPDAVRTVHDVAEAGDIRVEAPGRVAVVTAPGTPGERNRMVAEAVRGALGHVLPQDPTTYCHAASDREHALLRLAASSDAVLVLGRQNSPTLASLRNSGVRAYGAARSAEVRPAWLAGAAAVGIVAAPGASPALMADTLRALTGLGPSAVTRQVTTTLVDRGDTESG
ncbi:hypothetical protein ACIOC1_13295 [Streptomyces sp. NPDC088197]|uniref:hypothetical protein n=1 Tax=Streptomyces sp. NPDC088197 TaxID=3365840 RepID=UPI00380A5B31